MNVRLGCAGANSDTEFRASKVGARSTGALPLFNQVIEGFDGDDRDIKPLARFDLLFHRGGGMELTGILYLKPIRFEVVNEGKSVNWMEYSATVYRSRVI